MSVKEDREYLNDIKNKRDALKEKVQKEAFDAYNSAIIEREDLKAAHEAKLNAFYEYKDNVKSLLVSRALYGIYEKSLVNPNPRESKIGKVLIDNYVNEIGASKLLRNMKFSESALLLEIKDAVEDFYDRITDDATAEDVSTQTIKPEDIEDFWKQIDKSEDIQDITDLIRLRVSGAEEDFVNKNQEDKENVKTILKQTADRVKNAEETNDNDYAEAVEESETRIAKDKIYKIQHEGHRSVFDRMVRNISESVIKNEDAKKEFMLKNGRLDMDKIVESARCMYALLEIVSSLNIEKVDEAYIEQTLKSIK